MFTKIRNILHLGMSQTSFNTQITFPPTESFVKPRLRQQHLNWPASTKFFRFCVRFEWKFLLARQLTESLWNFVSKQIFNKHSRAVLNERTNKSKEEEEKVNRMREIATLAKGNEIVVSINCWGLGQASVLWVRNLNLHLINWDESEENLNASLTKCNLWIGWVNLLMTLEA